MYNFVYLLSASADGVQTQSGFQKYGFIFIMILLFAAMYFFTIRPQKQQQKKDQEMRENTQVGDEITTIGGIMGRVVTVKDDSIVIETGADRNKMKLARWAIQTNNTASEKVKAEREAAKAAQEKAAAEKKEKKSKKED